MAHPDPKQLPTKGKPWNALLSQDFIHKVDLILPQESVDKLRMKLAQDAFAPTHYRVIMKLSEILEGEFFTQYIKIADVALLSEGRMGQDNVFAIQNGILTMYLKRETYERAGLAGQPLGVKGKRGLKPRWIVQYDLKAKASFPGRKGFDRLLYACKTVLNQSLTWLFCCQSEVPKPDPLSKHFPAKYTSNPSFTEDIHTKTPLLKPSPLMASDVGRLELEEFATDIYEWLSLIRLDSPRIQVGDRIDPYLSRYAFPGDSEDLKQARLCCISWQGFISPAWARQALIDVILCLPSRSWFSMSVTSLGRGLTGDSTECTTLRPPDSPGEYFLWDIRGHE